MGRLNVEDINFCGFSALEKKFVEKFQGYGKLQKFTLALTDISRDYNC